MIEKLKYLLAGILVLAFAGGFVSCKEEDQVLNEWLETPYVFVKGQTTNNEFVRTFTVVETEGLTDDTPVVYAFRVCLNRIAESDVTVSLAAKASGNIIDMKENTMVLSAAKATIPAGQLQSEEVTLTIDPAFLAVNDAQGDYDAAVFTVDMSSPVSADERVKLSTKTNKVVLSIRKIVKAYLNLGSGTPSNSVTMDRSAWSGELGEGVENVIGNVFDGNTGTDVASNKVPWEFLIDTGAATEMLGFKIQYWGSGYSVSQLEIVTSMDRTTWKSQGILSISRSGTHNIKFLKPVTARYVKYRALEHPGRSSVTEFNVYIAK